MKYLRVAAIAAFALVVTTAFSQTTILSPKDLGGKPTPSIKQAQPRISLYTPDHSNATTTPSTKSTPSNPAPQTSQPTKTSAHPPVSSTPPATRTNDNDSSVIPDINWPVTVSGIAVVLLLGGWLWNRNKPTTPPTSTTPPTTPTSESTDSTHSSR